MSIKQMLLVWEHEFPHPEQSVMLALADHAHEDGSSIRPSVDRIAWKTGYAKRNVQLILKRLKASGVLVETKKHTNREPSHLRFDWTKAKPKPSFEEYKLSQASTSSRGAIFTPLEKSPEVINGSSPGVINGSSPGVINGSSPGVINGSPDPLDNRPLEPSINPNTPLAPQGGDVQSSLEKQVLEPEGGGTKDAVEPIQTEEVPANCSNSGDEKSPKKSRKKKKRRDNFRRAAAAVSQYYPTEALELYEEWTELFVALRGDRDDRAGFMDGFDTLIESGETVQDILEGTRYYIQNKLTQLKEGTRPITPPGGLYFFTGKEGHMTSYCLDALQLKRDRQAGKVGVAPIMKSEDVNAAIGKELSRLGLRGIIEDDWNGYQGRMVSSLAEGVKVEYLNYLRSIQSPKRGEVA